MSDSIKIQGFRDTKRVVAGPYWTLYEAVRIHSGTRHLLQVLDAAVAENSRLISLLRGSLNLTTILRHEHILAPVAFDETDDHKFLIYNYFNGQSLRSLLDARIPLVERRVTTIIQQMASALQFAQIRGVRHGWLMPESVLISKFDDEVKILGFGSDQLFAHLYDKDPDIAAAVNPYIPPEHLALATQPVPNDCYALGVLFYQLLLGMLPFHKEKVAELKKEKLSFINPPAELNPKISLEISDLALALIDPKPQRRAGYSTILDMLSPQRDTIVPLDRPPVETESGLSKVRDLVSSVNPVSKNLVGSKKRIAYTTILGLLFLLLILSAGILTQLSSSEERRLQQLYDEFVTEERYEQHPQANAAVPDELENQVVDSVDIVKKNNERIQQQSASIESAERPPVTEPPAPEPTPEESERAAAVPAELSLVVTTPSGRVAADVYIDGKRRGESDADDAFVVQELLVNKTYAVRVVKDGYQTWEKRVYVDETQKNLTVELKPDTPSGATFTFSAVAFADKIQFKHENVARNLPCTIELPFGTADVTYIDATSGFSWDTSFDLNEETKTLSVPAEQVGAGTLSIVLENPIEYGYAFVKINRQSEQHTTPFRTTVPVGWHQIQIFRQEYQLSPADTSVFVRPNAEVNIRCKVL
mgnify:CR=1 FL=1